MYEAFKGISPKARLDFLDAYVKNPSKFAFESTPSKVTAWGYLAENKSAFVRENTAYFDKFNQISTTVQEYIAKFTDNSVNSTLAKFLDDCDDAAFRTFINDNNNIDYVKSFMEYKNGIDVSAERASVISDEIREIAANNIREKVIYWYERSIRIEGNVSKFKIANAFGDANSLKIKNGSNPPCSAWGGNAGKVPHEQLNIKAASGKHVVLDDGIVHSTPVAYTGPNNDIPIYKVTYHDSKLTSNAGWTKNQQSEIIDVFSKPNAPDFIEFDVRSTQFPSGSPIGTNSKVRIYKTDVYKSVSNGDGQTIINTSKVF